MVALWCYVVASTLLYGDVFVLVGVDVLARVVIGVVTCGVTVVVVEWPWGCRRAYKAVVGVGGALIVDWVIVRARRGS